MFYVLKVQCEIIDIISMHTTYELAQAKAQDLAYSLIRYEVGDKRAAESHMSSVDAIVTDGYYYVVKPGVVTVYNKTTNSGWLRNDVAVTKVATFMVKEFSAGEEPTVAGMVLNRIASVPVFPMPRIGVLYLDELRGRLSVIRESVSPTAEPTEPTEPVQTPE